LIGVAAAVSVVAECWGSWYYWYCCSLLLPLSVWIGSLVNMTDTVAANGALHPRAVPSQLLLNKKRKKRKKKKKTKL